MIFYDNIENYIGSKWQGELQSIDVSQIKIKALILLYIYQIKI